MCSSMNVYIRTNLCHHRQIKIWNILEPILEVSHMSPPSQYSSAPPPHKAATILTFITIDSFACF